MQPTVAQKYPQDGKTRSAQQRRKSLGFHSDPAWFCDGFNPIPGLKREMAWSSKAGAKRHLTFYLCLPGQYDPRCLPPRHDRLTLVKPLARVNLPSFLVTVMHKSD